MYIVLIMNKYTNYIVSESCKLFVKRLSLLYSAVGEAGRDCGPLTVPMPFLDMIMTSFNCPVTMALLCL